MPTAYIGIGSNQGKPKDNIINALKMIDSNRQIKIAKVSSLYQTEPVGYEDQPWFYNCVAELVTELPPYLLLEALQSVENDLGRVRTIRWGPRTIDLDILLYEQVRMDDEALTIPHPRMKERAFVMVPLAEIAGQAVFPDGQRIIEAAKVLKDEKKYSCIPQKLW